MSSVVTQGCHIKTRVRTFEFEEVVGTLRISLDDRADTTVLFLEEKDWIKSYNSLEKQSFVTNVSQDRRL